MKKTQQCRFQLNDANSTLNSVGFSWIKLSHQCSFSWIKLSHQCRFLLNEAISSVQLSPECACLLVVVNPSCYTSYHTCHAQWYRMWSDLWTSCALWGTTVLFPHQWSSSLTIWFQVTTAVNMDVTIRPLSYVFHPVRLHVRQHIKWPATHITLVGFLSCMNQSVSRQYMSVAKRLATNLTMVVTSPIGVGSCHTSK